MRAANKLFSVYGGPQGFDLISLNPVLYFSAPGGSMLSSGGVAAVLDDSIAAMTNLGSGNDATQTTESLRAIYKDATDGGPAALFDGADDYYDITLSADVAGTLCVASEIGTYFLPYDRIAGNYEFSAKGITTYHASRNERVFAIILFPTTLTAEQETAVRSQMVALGAAADFSGVTSFDYHFREMYLESIPEGFLDTATAATSFAACFESNSLTSIPSGLFDNTTLVTDFGVCFNNNSLTSIPAGLFDNTTAATSFSQCFRNNSLTAIPSGLFDNTPLVTDFANCFNNNSLTSIPTSLFDNTTAATSFGSCFRNNSLTAIPAGLFDNTTAVTRFGSCFRNNSLTAIPSGLFDNTPLVTRFDYCFFGNSLTSIPAGLFDNTTAVTNFEACFYNNSITAISSGLFDNTTAVTNFAFCFFGNTALTTVPAGLFDNWNPSTISSAVFNEVFGGCTSLTATSVENILVSIDTSGQYGTNNGTSGGTALADAVIDIDYDGSGLTATTNTAITSLKGKGWGIEINGVLQ